MSDRVSEICLIFWDLFECLLKVLNRIRIIFIRQVLLISITDNVVNLNQILRI